MSSIPVSPIDPNQPREREFLIPLSNSTVASLKIPFPMMKEEYVILQNTINMWKDILIQSEEKVVEEKVEENNDYVWVRCKMSEDQSLENGNDLYANERMIYFETAYGSKMNLLVPLSRICTRQSGSFFRVRIDTTYEDGSIYAYIPNPSRCHYFTIKKDQIYNEH